MGVTVPLSQAWLDGERVSLLLALLWVLFLGVVGRAPGWEPWFCEEEDACCWELLDDIFGWWVSGMVRLFIQLRMKDFGLDRESVDGMYFGTSVGG